MSSGSVGGRIAREQHVQGSVTGPPDGEDDSDGEANLKVDDDVAGVVHPGAERLDGEDGRERERLPAADVDVRAVPRADGVALVEVEVALAERPVVVRAAILDRVDLAAEVVDAHRDLARVDDLHLARGQLVERADVDLGQGAGDASAARARRARPTPRGAACPSRGGARP